jgi:hypothetical protein
MAVNLSPVFGVAGQLFDNNGNPLAGGKIFTYAAGTTTLVDTYTNSLGNIAHSNPIVLDGAGRVPSGEIWLTDGIQYKFVVEDAASNLIGTYDNLIGINSNFVAFTNEQEIQTAIAGQTVFNLTTMQYQPSINSLSVFVDGVNQYGPGAQYAYVETDQDTVTFVSGLHVGASVKFTTSQLNSSGGGDACNVSYTAPFTGATLTTVCEKLSETISVKDFGAIPDDLTSDLNAFILARNNQKAYTVPYGNYSLPSAFDSQNTPLISYGATFNLGSPATTYLRSFIDLGSKSILRKSIRDPSEYTGTPTTYTYVTDLTSIDIRHQNGAGYQQFYNSDAGGRTSVPAIYIEGSSFSYGDVPGVSVHYGISRHPNWASITGSWTGANSVVLYDGQSTALTNNVNIYGAEYHLDDNANDRVAANGLVLVFNRQNGNPSVGGQYNTVWTGVRIQTSGTYACDSGLSINGKWNVGIDFTGANLSNKAAIALKTDDRIYFGAPATSPPLWYANVLSNNYQVFDGTKYNFVVNNVSALTIAQNEVVSTEIHKFIKSFNVVSSGNISQTVGAAGVASVLPAQPFTYLKIKIDGVTYKIPVYQD